MIYKIKFSEQFKKSFYKLKKKDKAMFERIKKKLNEIIKTPDHYKPLRNVLAGFNRVQFGSLVLIFEIDENVVRIISLDHHDKAY